MNIDYNFTDISQNVNLLSTNNNQQNLTLNNSNWYTSQLELHKIEYKSFGRFTDN